MSFGFRVRKDAWDRPKDVNAPVIRTLLDVDLLEVSPVAFPAYPQTEVQARNLDEAMVRAKIEELDKADQVLGKPVGEFRTRLAKAALRAKFYSDIL